MVHEEDTKDLVVDAALEESYRSVLEGEATPSPAAASGQQQQVIYHNFFLKPYPLFYLSSFVRIVLRKNDN